MKIIPYPNGLLTILDVFTGKCLFLYMCFYEWQWLDLKGRQKQKYPVGFPGGALFAFAGVDPELHAEPL